jgi:quercetin dioxygenase-like cupin family protein
MKLKKLDEIQEREIVPGYKARFVHSENMTIAYWNIKAGYSMPEHVHIHEQVLNIIEGTLELIVEGKSHVVEPNNVVVIPSNAPHSGTSITDCRIIDVFYPVREDYC